MRVGEAKNPGPFKKNEQTKEVSLLSLNVGGAPGAWRLFHEKFSGADIVCLQECNMNASEWQCFLNKCTRLGYKGFFQPGHLKNDRWGHERMFGGVAILVHRSVFFSFATFRSLWGIQTIAVWVKGMVCW